MKIHVINIQNCKQDKCEKVGRWEERVGEEQGEGR
jgi:hypothetical protein